MPGPPNWVSMAGVLARARSMYRALFHRAEVEQEMREEFQHHLAERAEDLVRGGLTPDVANAQARREFGHQGIAIVQSAIQIEEDRLDHLISDSGPPNGRATER